MWQMIKFFAIVFCMGCITLNTAAADDYDMQDQGSASEMIIQRHAFNAPNHVSNNLGHLVKYLTRPFKNDYDKLKVIAYWIASHLAYDHYKYDNGQTYQKEFKYKYDILKAKMGICSDFAKLYKEMADAAGVSADVEYVTGYVFSPRRIKSYYTQREIPSVGHAWNEITLKRRKFFVDTTYMCANRVGQSNKKYKSSLAHRQEVRKRNITKEKFSTNINTFYFDFTPQQEYEKTNKIHLLGRYVY